MVDIAGQYRNDPHMRAVSLGLDTEHFVSNDKVGKYLVEKAHQKRIEALEALALSDPMDSAEILRLQWQARVPDLFLQWLDEAIGEGRAMEEIILQEETLGL
jgi:hypothetical protein